MSLAQEQAIRVYDPDVDRLRMARYYLESELPNIIQANDTPVSDAIRTSVEALAPQQVWRLLEAVSYTYRINDVFALVSDSGITWQELELPLQAITLTGIGPRIDDIIYSAAIQCDPQKFAAYLNSYFASHPELDDDPEQLNECRPRQQAMRHEVLMTREHKGQIRMLDGSHRLIALAMAGTISIRCFNASANSTIRKRRVGDSTFVTLLHLYKRFPKPEQREAILTTATLLARDSLDGPEAIHAYWVEHQRSSRIKQIGRALLARVRRP